MSNQFTNNPARAGFARFFGKGNPALVEIIAERIRREGKITFADFMELALYHPQLGYYRSPRQRIGADGDFITGPETHPVFGALLVRQLGQMWELLGRPAAFDVVEMGAGSGALCRDVLTYARAVHPELFAALRYRIVESSDDAIAKQKARLRASHLRLGAIRWYSSLSQMPARGITGCLVSNELVDAFPAHRVFKDREEIKEIYVGLADGQFVDICAEPSTPAIADYFAWIDVRLAEGSQAEVNLRSIEWMREVAHRVKKGFVVTIDYGYPAPELYSAAHRRGTLLCYYKHTYTEDPYVRVGQQDITTHVDFTALAKAGEEGGLTSLALCHQRDFLLALGWPTFLAALEQQGLAAVEYRANRLAMEDLVKPDDLGRLKVLIQSKGLGVDSSAAVHLLSTAPLSRDGIDVPLLGGYGAHPLLPQSDPSHFSPPETLG